MRIEMKWSENRQMWVGQARARQTQKSGWSSLMSWLQPSSETTRQRRPMPVRVWQSAKAY
jgi:hypothetical protein